MGRVEANKKARWVVSTITLGVSLFWLTACSSTTGVGTGTANACVPGRANCSMTEKCDDDQGCVPLLSCGPSNCSNGCCSRNQCIRPGTDGIACGKGGDLCLDCERVGSSCNNGTCGAPCDSSNCSGCCDSEGECLDSREQTQRNLCGTRGGVCSGCDEGQSCKNGECQVDVCQNTCPGCCRGQECIQNPSEGCGINGATCKPCGDGTCSDGQCVSAACSDTCGSGCCTLSGACEPGDDTQACGELGRTCLRCTGGKECYDGVCELGRQSRWNVVIESAEVPIRDNLQQLWDFAGLPDVYIELQLGGGLDPLTVESQRLFDNFVFDFLSEVVVTDITMETILNGFQVTWYDWDLVNFDDVMHTATQTHDVEAFDGELLSFESGAFKLHYRLVPFEEDANDVSPNTP